MHYYQFNIADYRKDTMHLIPQEHYIYRSVLDTYYLTEKPLPLDINAIMRTHCIRIADDVRYLENILKDFFIKCIDGYHHKRVDLEIEAFHNKSKSAKSSANARWKKESCERIANAMPTQCDGNANHKPLTINHKPRTNNQELETNKTIPKEKHIAPIAMLMAMGVSKELSNDWLKVRKEKKQAPTQTAFNKIKSHAEESGYTFEQAVKISIENGWAGFNASWLGESKQVKAYQTKGERISTNNDKALDEFLNGKIYIKTIEGVIIND